MSGSRDATSKTGRAIDYGELPDFLGYQLRRVQTGVFAEFEATLGDLGLTPGAFGLLTLIRANPGVNQMELAGAFGIDKSTLTPALQRLEARGLIRRERLAADRRHNALFFEADREAFYRDAAARVRRFEEGVAGRLDAAERVELARLLAKLRRQSCR